MPYKDRAKRLDYQKDWYKRKKDEIKAKHAQWRKENKTALMKWFVEFKATLKCMECPENFPPCLQFHHRDPAEKRFNISQALRLCVCKEEILKEIAKCDVLCANCHVKRHYRI